MSLVPTIRKCAEDWLIKGYSSRFPPASQLSFASTISVSSENTGIVDFAPDILDEERYAPSEFFPRQTSRFRDHPREVVVDLHVPKKGAVQGPWIFQISSRRRHSSTTVYKTPPLLDVDFSVPNRGWLPSLSSEECEKPDPAVTSSPWSRSMDPFTILKVVEQLHIPFLHLAPRPTRRLILFPFFLRLMANGTLCVGRLVS